MTLYYQGALLGLCTFLIIGVFHPIVIKAEYYFGTRSWWAFLVAGIAAVIGALYIQSVFYGASSKSLSSANASSRAGFR